MKKPILCSIFSLIILMFSWTVVAQSPEKMNYQAVVRDASGALVKSAPIGVRLSILQGSATGVAVYVENHALSANANGLVTGIIGNGTVETGTMISIDWAKGPYFIKTEMDPLGGTSYSITTTNQLLSVPYALYAKTCDSSIVIDTIRVMDTVSTNWSLKGNSATNPDSNFMGTKDNKNFVFKRNNIDAGFVSIDNTAFGNNTMKHNSSVFYNVAFGNNVLSSITTGGENTAVGHDALTKNTRGGLNSAFGRAALSNNIDGIRNTAVGYWSLLSNTEGGWNTACGSSSLAFNTTGNTNVAVGATSLYYNTSGSGNTATGFEALYNNLTGRQNVANGADALFSNTTGDGNVAIGSALQYNTSGSYNAGIGVLSLSANNVGSYNTAIGYNSMASNKKGVANVAIGFNAYFLVDSLSNTICLGSSSGGVSSASNRAEIGNSSMSWIGGQVSWSTFSDKRIKKDIKENIPGLSFITKLRPVTYRIDAHKQYQMLAEKGKADTFQYAEKYDIEKVTQTGFLAQEVAEAAKSLGYEFSGVDIPKTESELYSIRYSDFVMPLVKAVQEQQELIERQQILVEKLEKRIAELEAKR